MPATRDKLLPAVREGLADIAVGNLTVTDERLKLVDFVAPQEKPDVFELLVTGPAPAPCQTPSWPTAKLQAAISIGDRQRLP